MHVQILESWVNQRFNLTTRMVQGLLTLILPSKIGSLVPKPKVYLFWPLDKFFTPA
jgi:hypothetical protein